MNEKETITVTADEYRRLHDAIYALSMKLTRYYPKVDVSDEFEPIDDLLSDFQTRLFPAEADQ